jgi:DNA-binding Lrp family transcriptional regulator
MRRAKVNRNLEQQNSQKGSIKHPVRACVLIRVRHGRHFQVANQIANIPGVKSAFAVVGAADVVVRIEVRDMSALVAVGTRIGDLQDVSTTETFVAAEV